MSNDLRTILIGYKRKMEVIAQKSCEAVSDKIKDRTPVLSGDLRDSWIVDPQPNALRIGDTYRMGTDSPYGAYIEYLSPPARNAPITKYAEIGQPYGMMRRSIAEWSQIVEGVASGS